MSKVRLYGDTSGFVDLKAPDVASNVTITLPNTTGPFATETYVDSEIAAIPEIAGIGSNAQSATLSSGFSTTSTSFVEVPTFNVSITPTSSESKILVIATFDVQLNSGDFGYYTLYRGDVATGTNLGLAFGGLGRTGLPSGDGCYVALHLIDSPATASEVKYTVAVKRGESGTLFVSAVGTQGCRITAIEVSA